jgi:hypothetical protein
MQSDVFTPIINKFNDLIDSLIKDYEEFNLDKDTLGFLATKTRNFINFNKLTLNNVIFATLEKFEVDGYDFNSIASESKEFMNSIFDKMAESVDNILHEDDNQEHHHDHGHDHHQHHYHIHIDEVQDDIDKIKEYLKILKELINYVAVILISSLKYKANAMSKEEFDKEFTKFKENLDNLKTKL